MQWSKATKSEFDSLLQNQIWDFVDLSDRNNLMGCKWIFKHKREVDWQIQLKVQLVAQGYSQKFGIDYDEVFTPVRKYNNELNLAIH